MAVTVRLLRQSTDNKSPPDVFLGMEVHRRATRKSKVVTFSWNQFASCQEEDVLQEIKCECRFCCHGRGVLIHRIHVQYGIFIYLHVVVCSGRCG